VRWRSLWASWRTRSSSSRRSLLWAGEVRGPARGLEPVLAVPVLERALAALEQRLGLSPGRERLSVGLGGRRGRRLRARLEEERPQAQEEAAPDAHSQVGELERFALGGAVLGRRLALLHSRYGTGERIALGGDQNRDTERAPDAPESS